MGAGIVSSQLLVRDFQSEIRGSGSTTQVWEQRQMIDVHAI
jgi:hypothetical protein